MRSHARSNNLTTIVAKYHQMAFVYHDFLAAMQTIVVSVLDQRGFKYQVSQRLKTVDSIRAKEARNAKLGRTYRRLADLEDLAGIRIVFLLESDKRRFLSALFGELTRDRLNPDALAGPERARVALRHRAMGHDDPSGSCERIGYRADGSPATAPSSFALWPWDASGRAPSLGRYSSRFPASPILSRSIARTANSTSNGVERLRSITT